MPKQPPLTNSRLQPKRSFAGIGLFTTYDIKKGERIIEYFGRELSEDEQYTSKSKYLFGIGKKRMVDGNLKENLARYINHSCIPNAEPEERNGRVFIFARRNIKTGEEITYDYGKEYFDTYFKDGGCRCAKCIKKKK